MKTLGLGITGIEELVAAWVSIAALGGSSNAHGI